MASIGFMYLTIIGCVVILVNAAAIDDNLVYTETPRIRSSDELISSIVDNCFKIDTMHCLKEKVLTYLDTLVGLNEEQGRAFAEKNIDKVIFARLGRVLQTHEFKVQLPQTFFQNMVMTYRADRGVDIELPKEEARGDLLKKKLLLPVLLLLKLKLKALMPIFVALIGIKAIKALILSKLAIKLVLGFLIYNLIQKLGGMKMSMMPMMPAPEPMNTYGVPEPTTPPTSSSYSAGSWEPSGGPYSRWDSSGSSSAQSLAYSAYYPSSSSSSGSSYPSSSSSGSSASSPSSSSSYSSYTS